MEQILLVIRLAIYVSLTETIYGGSPVQEIFRLHATDPPADLPMPVTSRANAPANSAKPVPGQAADAVNAANLATSSTGAPLPAPRNLTLLTTSLDPDGKAYAQVSWLPPLAATIVSRVVSGSSLPVLAGLKTQFVPVDRYRISWHEQSNPKEEFRKTVDGDTTSYTIEHLPVGSHVVVEVQAFRWIDDKKLRGLKASLIVRTAFRKSTYAVSADTQNGQSSSFPLADHNITVNSVYYQNGLLKANLSWSALPDPEPNHASAPTDSSFPALFVIRWYPKVCLGSERKHGSPEQLLVKPLLTTTNVNSVIVYDLNFNCRYAVAIYQRSVDSTSKTVAERLRGVKHFITPMCQDVQITGSVAPNCPKLPPRLPGPPQNLSCLFLVQMTEISATCSWETPLNSEQPIVGYRTMYAKKILDARGLYGIHPFPVFDRNSFIMKVLDDDEMSFSVASLEEETEYIVYIQAVSAAGFGAMTKLEFVTPRLIHSTALSQIRSEKDSLLTAGKTLSNGGNSLPVLSTYFVSCSLLLASSLC